MNALTCPSAAAELPVAQAPSIPESLLWCCIAEGNPALSVSPLYVVHSTCAHCAADTARHSSITCLGPAILQVQQPDPEKPCHKF